MKNWLAAILKFLPVVLSTVKAVEDTVQAPGATKKQVAIGIIRAGASAAEQFPESDVQTVGTLIDTVVSVFNQSGVFSKSPVASK